MADLDDAIRTTVDVPAEFSDRKSSAGSYGNIVEKYGNPEGHAADVIVNRPELVGVFEELYE